MARAANKAGIPDEVFSFLKELWKDVKEKVVEETWLRIKKEVYKAQKRFSGETIAVFGPPAAGKSTLLKVLQNVNTPAAELQTFSKTELEEQGDINVDFKLSVGPDEQVRFRFKVRKNSDVGGEEYIRKLHWPAVIKGAAVVIYMLEGPKLLSDDSQIYRERVFADFDWLLEQSQLLHENFAIVLGFNKVDELCDTTTYKSFVREHGDLLEKLKLDIQDRWPEHLVSHIKGGIFLSLLEPRLRAFTLNGLVSCFVGDELMKLYRQPT
ncbi:MAG: ATP-binding cassette domain-containing protein [Betaproteobacteria bacterium]|nr:MAG: ATP-binding cassette domain-containing protein [Betaproteobacteria bacterium]